MTRKRLGTKNIRDIERDQVRRLNDNGVYLPNPQAGPSFDKHAPIPSTQKALAFGMEPTEPKRLFELPRGDAGAGQTVYRKIHAFYSLVPEPTLPPAPPGAVGRSNYTKALPIITMRSANQNPKYWHVSLYGIGVRRPASAVPQLPLTDDEIKSAQFEQYFVETPPGTFVPLSPRFVPSVPTAQARIMVHDESGQRFFDADIIGNRSFSLYGFGVTVFLLVKEDGYEVNFQNPDSLIPLTGNAGGVEDDLIGARVVGLFSNRTESIQNRTLSVSIDPAATGPNAVIIPVPPGSRKVQIFTDPTPVVADWRLEFYYGRALDSGAPGVGVIDINAGQAKTDIIDIPNAPSIAIRPLNPGATPITNFFLVFEVEP